MNFRNVQLILKREYWQRVRSPGFIIGTVLVVLLMLGLGVVPALLKLLDQNTASKVAVVDPNNLVYSYLEILSRPTPTPLPGSTPPPTDPSALPLTQSIRFVQAATADETALAAQVTNDEIKAYIVVSGDKPSTATFVYHGKDRPGGLESVQLNAYLSSALMQGKLQEFGITAQQAQSLFTQPQLKVEPIVGATLKDEDLVVQSTILVYVLLILLYITLLMYGIQVAMGVVEEKSSRVMEILITAVRPIELLAGKVLGVGLAGLTQTAVWIGSGLLISAFGGAVGSIFGGIGLDVAAIPATTLLSFLLFFILGYLLFAAMYAALGSLVNKVEDVNNVTSPLTIVMVGVYLVAIFSLSNPDAEFVRALSFVPFFTPMLMFIRVALGSVEIWEFLLATALLALSAYLLTWLAAKIYRVGVLLYGKRPSLREIARLLRTA